MSIVKALAGVVSILVLCGLLIVGVIHPAIVYEQEAKAATSGEVLDKYVSTGFLGMGDSEYCLKIAVDAEVPNGLGWLYGDGSTVFTVSEAEYNSVKVGDIFTK